ncbi:hypothetical protein BGZ93_010239 [Podila epicladia]|nr:hypothetical protein BGZ92_004333 [Podila epicladia]KAG0088794.1 hypothetical protein BGZ93_010239 [Podila epicladia]
MADTFPQDATPHPRQGDHSPSARSTSRPHSRQGATPEPKKSTSGSRPFIFHTRHDSTASEDADSGNSDDSDSDDGDVDSQHRHRKSRRSRRRRLSASHLLAQAPAVPDLRFDHNYRKALDQIYDAHAADLAKAEAARAQAASSSTGTESQDKKKRKSSSSQQQQEEEEATVHSIRTRIAVMTLRDIIIMPFVHGFFWGFGTILLTLASQRSLAYHLTRSFNRVFGRESVDGGAGQQPPVFRGEPARIRRAGNATGLGGVGLSGGRPGFAN